MKPRAPIAFAALLLGISLMACHHAAPPAVVHAPQPVPAAAPQSLVVLLPEPGGKLSGLTITNSAGMQTLDRPNQAVRIQRADVSPGAPFMMGADEVRQVFGPLLDALPAPEMSILLYFGLNSDTLTAESQAELPRILEAVRQRHSTSISVIGHTDTTGNSQSNYQLGLRRAQSVIDILRAQGAKESDLTAESHGDADLLIKTGAGVDEPRNRRVEVIVR